MARDVKQFFRSCVVCQQSKLSNKLKQSVEQMVLGRDSPGAVVVIDIGTLPWVDGEFRYFLLMMDLLTRLIEVVLLHDQTYKSVVTAFEQGWIYQDHGVPEIIVTDQGSQLDGEEFRVFCRPLGIEKRHTTTYYPQCDGMAERNIGLVNQVIVCLVLNCQLSKGSWV